jgi:hypothetical protein
MKSTFEILGPAVNGKGISVGTAFLIGKQATPESFSASNVLVTAAHVLGSIKGDTASLLVRNPTGNGLYAPFEFLSRSVKTGVTSTPSTKPPTLP